MPFLFSHTFSFLVLKKNKHVNMLIKQDQYVLTEALSTNPEFLKNKVGMIFIS